MIECRFARHSLPLEQPFATSRSTTEAAAVGIVEVEAEGVVGIGGCAPVGYLGDSMDAVESTMPDLFEIVDGLDSKYELDRLDRTMRREAPESPAARAAVSMALQDLVSRSLELPLYRYWGLSPESAPPSTVTIGLQPIPSVRSMAAKCVGLGFDRLKIKLDADRPVETVAAVRAVAPKAGLVVDANGAWDESLAVEVITRIADYDVELIEQPVPAEDREALAGVSERVSVPVFADEACQSAGDIPIVADACDGVVLKLMKCGGLRAAWEFIHTAQAHECSVLLGCMVESNASIAPACHLAPAVEYVDLDGAMLLETDVYRGIPHEGGRFDLPAVTRGTGVSSASP